MRVSAAAFTNPIGRLFAASCSQWGEASQNAHRTIVMLSERRPSSEAGLIMARRCPFVVRAAGRGRLFLVNCFVDKSR